jgi:hypothetical protein
MEELSAWDEFEQEGEIKQSHRILLRWGGTRFGPADPRIHREVEAIRDLDRLDRMADAVLTATSWQELLATA